MNSRAKGQRGERAFRDLLREEGYLQARRGQQYAGNPDAPDVVCPELDCLHFEVKAVERLNVHDAVAQAVRDAGEGQIPVVAHKRNRGKWLITIRAEDFFRLVRESDLEGKG